jgi:hypothetical protein
VRSLEGDDMGLIIEISILLALSLSLSGPPIGDNDAQGPRPKILVHYMPWFESKATSGHWGWHWTMNHFDPERFSEDGRRQIASHDYPLIGPYDSADHDVLEYHTLLMKVAGIDGVIADWYGSEDFNDYATIHRRTISLFDSLKKRDLKFAICYEDRVLNVIAERARLTPAGALDHGKDHLRYCEQNWFKESSYVTWDGKPLLLVFGPDYLKPTQWEAALSGMRPTPAYFTLHERKLPAIGSFAWPPMWAAKEGKLDEKELDAYLDRFSKQEGLKIACAFPGFHDIYREAGTQPSHGYLDSRNGETFRHTLERALTSGGPLIQIATWNDFGEGTCIEPSREYGYRYLEEIQNVRVRRPGEPFAYRPADLRLPLRIYTFRKRLVLTEPERKAIDGAVDALFAGEVAPAWKSLDEVEKSSSPSRPAP